MKLKFRCQNCQRVLTVTKGTTRCPLCLEPIHASELFTRPRETVFSVKPPPKYKKKGKSMWLTADSLMNYIRHTDLEAEVNKAKKKGRTTELILLRKRVIRALRDVKKLSFPAIAKLLGMHHTTCIHHYYND